VKLSRSSIAPQFDQDAIFEALEGRQRKRRAWVIGSNGTENSVKAFSFVKAPSLRAMASKIEDVRKSNCRRTRLERSS
jgi:hypothetical protein